jgi:hypothetical protein
VVRRIMATVAPRKNARIVARDMETVVAQIGAAIAAGGMATVVGRIGVTIGARGIATAASLVVAGPPSRVLGPQRPLLHPNFREPARLASLSEQWRAGISESRSSGRSERGVDRLSKHWVGVGLKRRMDRRSEHWVGVGLECRVGVGLERRVSMGPERRVERRSKRRVDGKPARAACRADGAKARQRQNSHRRPKEELFHD